MSTVDKDFKVKNGLAVTGGGAFGGAVTVATPTENSHAATKQYVDSNAGGGSSLTVSDVAPENPSIGDQWYNSGDGVTYVYYDSFWVESSSGGQSASLDGYATETYADTAAATAAAAIVDDAGKADNEKFWLLAASTVSTISETLPANIPMDYRIITAEPSASFNLTAFNGSGVEIESFAVSTTALNKKFAENVTTLKIGNNYNSDVWLVVSAPTSSTVDLMLDTIVIDSTQSVVLDKNYTAYAFGGGGGGGGIPASIDDAGAGGGGSGYYVTGTLTAGTYTATIGASGLGVSGADGTTGGTTSIGAISAAGGFGGKAPTTTAVGGNGGDGGSGGCGGVATTTTTAMPNSNFRGGFQGSDGETNLLFGAAISAGVGGSGSGIAVPQSALDDIYYVIRVATSGGRGTTPNSSSTAGGLYAGGGGGNVNSNITVLGGSATSPNGGGGGANGDLTGALAQLGGNGGQGVIYLIEEA